MAKAEGKLEKDREDDRSKEQLGLRGIGTRQSPFAPFNSLYLSMLSLRPRGGSATATSTSGGAVPPGHSRELGTGWASAPSRKKMPGADACLPALGPRNEVGGISRVVPGRRRGRPSSLDFAAACGLVDYGSVHVPQRQLAAAFSPAKRPVRIRRFFGRGRAPHVASAGGTPHAPLSGVAHLLGRAVDLTNPSGEPAGGAAG